MSDVEVEVTIKHETDKAYLIACDSAPGGEVECWIPKSKVSDYCEELRNGKQTITSVFIPEWLATEKGLI